MLVVSYLQRKYKVGGTEGTDLGKHLIDFLELYGTQMNYREVGISIREGGFYFQKKSRGWEERDERRQNNLCVENP